MTPFLSLLCPIVLLLFVLSRINDHNKKITFSLVCFLILLFLEVNLIFVTFQLFYFEEKRALVMPKIATLIQKIWRGYKV